MPAPIVTLSRSQIDLINPIKASPLLTFFPPDCRVSGIREHLFFYFNFILPILYKGSKNTKAIKNIGAKYMKHMVIKSVLMVSWLLFILIEITWGHPHVFIAQNLKIVFDEKGMTGFNVYWKFDDMFSNMICEDHDLNKNGILEKTEIASIKTKAFSYIAEFNYFIYVKIDGTPFKVQFVTDFSARLENGKLIYDFFIPCHISAAKNFKHINIASYDPNYYSTIYFTEQHPFTIENNDKFEVNALIKEDKATLIYYDMVNPWALFLDFRLK